MITGRAWYNCGKYAGGGDGGKQNKNSGKTEKTKNTTTQKRQHNAQKICLKARKQTKTSIVNSKKLAT